MENYSGRRGGLPPAVQAPLPNQNPNSGADAAPFRNVIEELNCYFAGELHLFRSPRAGEPRFPAPRLEGTREDPYPGDDLVRPIGHSDRQSRGERTCRGLASRMQPYRNHRPLPPGDRARQPASGLRRRPLHPGLLALNAAHPHSPQRFLGKTPTARDSRFLVTPIIPECGPRGGCPCSDRYRVITADTWRVPRYDRSPT